MIVLEERVKRRKPLDDCDWKIIRKPLGMSWKVITVEETEQQEGR
jgi:hypothetical protein